MVFVQFSVSALGGPVFGKKTSEIHCNNFEITSLNLLINQQDSILRWHTFTCRSWSWVLMLLWLLSGMFLLLVCPHTQLFLESPPIFKMWRNKMCKNLHSNDVWMLLQGWRSVLHSIELSVCVYLMDWTLWAMHMHFWEPRPSMRKTPGCLLTRFLTGHWTMVL